MKRNLSLLLMALFLLSACTPRGALTSTEAGDLPVETATTAPTATPTEAAATVLNVCTANLPVSLFPYDGKNTLPKQNLLAWTQADQDLLAEQPTEANGGISMEPVTVQTGEIVVDASGTLVTLKAGVVVRPSGCRSSDCAIAWDGTTPLSMDQMSVTFNMVNDLSWSDGTPLTAADSVLSYDLASDHAAPGLQWVESHTLSYIAQSEQQIVWTGLPGFSTADIASLFWRPVPSHLLAGAVDFAAVSSDSLWSGAIASLGRYQVASWTEETIQLVRNELSPANPGEYDEIHLLAISNLDDAFSALAAGTCDVLDASYHLEQNAEALSILESDASLTTLVAQTPSWMQLVFGIQPASYDDYYNPLYGDRPDFFGDSRTRQAITACLDQDAIQEAVYAGLGEGWSSFISPAESVLAQDQTIGHDPALGAQLLEAVGWRDHDLNPATPLQAWYIGNIPSNTTFEIQLYVDSSTISQAIASIVQSSLGECGIGVSPVTLPSNELYEISAAGPLFGRQFDLALMAWAPLPQLDCVLYRSDQIPSEGNSWIGTNIAGLADTDYDTACSDGSLALPTEKETALGLTEEQFAATLPVVPLMSIPQVMIVRSEVCSAVDALWAGESGFFGCD